MKREVRKVVNVGSASKAVIQKEIKGKMDKELEKQEADNEKGKCVMCGK